MLRPSIVIHERDGLINPPQVYNMIKSDRPLINIPPTHHTHQDPLRTPEDNPVRPPWISTHIDGVYHLSPFDIEHNRFPDIEDRSWAMGVVSPPSPSRRNSLELFPDINDAVSSQYPYDADDLDWEEGTTSPPSPPRRNSLELPPPSLYSDGVPDMDDLPILSPPSPSMQSLSCLPDQEQEPDRPPADLRCPELSPPSPVQCSTFLTSFDIEAHTLFVEDTPASPFEQFQVSMVNSPLHEEYRALSSLRDRTMYAERTSRARNKALRGREREIGRAVAELRASAVPSSGSHSMPDALACLHAYRTAATRVMLERTEEKRRRKKDKERLKELRVLLGTGVRALLSTEGGLSPDATPKLGIGFDPAGDHANGLGLAFHEPPSEDQRARALAERIHVMHRLSACMTMRRRDLGMRSLVEAGNMAEGAEMSPRAACQPSKLAHVVLFSDLDDPGSWN